MGDFLKYQKLPPGWDCKLDQATGNCYYVNYLTKAMQLEDPRNRYRQLQNERCSTESIPLQHLHGPSSIGGSPYHVYPSNNLTVMRAFHTPGASGGGSAGMPPSSIYGTSTSPLLTSRGQMEMSPLPLQKSAMGMVQMPRMMTNMSRRSTIQETSFSTHIDTDVVVAKIQNMFPTASENHIRLLLKKYYNREAVVISALQVEKHPVTMPGPIATPPAQRHLLFPSNSAFHMTPPVRRLDIGAQSLASRGTQSRTASPIPAYFGRFGSVMSVQGCPPVAGGYSTLAYGSPGIGRVLTDAALMQGYAPGSPQWRSSPKPHSSPKMKLRYMKNIFPKADELLILDILSESDNNVQMASEKLLALGYAKRDYMQPPKVSTRADGAAGTDAADGGPAKSADAEGQIIIPLRPKEYSNEEKTAMHQRLKEKYPRVAERIIVMALESVSYGEDRAMQILQIVQEEEEAKTAAGLAMSASMGHKEMLGPEGRTGAEGEEQTVDNIIGVVVDAEPASLPEDAANAPPQITTSTFTTAPQLPSINVTTPTTAATQINLCHTPSQQAQTPPPPPPTTAGPSGDKANVRAPSHATSSSSAPPSSPPPSPSSFSSSPTYTFAYEKLTTAGLLGRCAANMHDTFAPTTTCAADYMNPPIHSATITSATASPPSSIASLLDTLKLTRRSRDKSETLKNSQRNSTESAADEQKLRSQFKNLIGRIKTEGHNPELSRGPDEDLLLADYVTWNGANPHIALGPQNQYLAHGPDATVLVKRPFTALGHNADLCKGPQKGLAKGSVYSHLSTSATAANAASNVLKCN